MRKLKYCCDLCNRPLDGLIWYEGFWGCGCHLGGDEQQKVKERPVCSAEVSGVSAYACRILGLPLPKATMVEE